MFKKNDGSSDQVTIIALSARIKGDLDADGDIRVDGIMKGLIKTTQKVYVSENAELRGNIFATEADVEGQINGDIKTDRLFLFATARIIGNIETKVLRIEEGAFLNGTIKTGMFPEQFE